MNGTGFDAAYAELVALYRVGQLDRLVERAGPLVRAHPHIAPLHNLIGAALAGLGQLDRAVEAYSRALAIDPGSGEAVNNLGVALRRLGRLDAAVQCHRRALAIDPDHAGALNNLGTALRELGRGDEATDCYRRAAALRPDLFEPHRNLGNMMVDAGRREDALASFATALAVRPDDGYARAQKLYLQAQRGDWSDIRAEAALIPGLGLSGSAVSPFTLMALDDSPERHRARAERYLAERIPNRPERHFARSGQRPDRLRIGYFSADFRDHATMVLMAGLIERHDCRRFDIHLYSFGPATSDDTRRRLLASAEHFEDVRAIGDADIAALARRDGIDIAVDLQGLTQNARPGIFAERAAPVQMGWLGYPGTLGMPLLDYLVADRWVIPDDERHHYAEKIVYLPDSYQVNDDRRPIAAITPSRAALGLPERGFVFACFNARYKIGPGAFAIWMRLLAEVDGAVLWLLGGDPDAEAHLRKEARDHGIAPERLIFADPLPPAEHLARLRQADLFLDCFAYNAHTTASDALWAGLPVLTTPGRSFSARVAASLLDAAGLPELIAPDRDAYAALALELARTPEKLAALRDRLLFGRLACPLFDTARFAANLEAVYDAIDARNRSGRPPADLDLAAGKATFRPI